MTFYRVLAAFLPAGLLLALYAGFAWQYLDISADNADSDRPYLKTYVETLGPVDDQPLPPEKWVAKAVAVAAAAGFDISKDYPSIRPGYDRRLIRLERSGADGAVDKYRDPLVWQLSFLSGAVDALLKRRQVELSFFRNGSLRSFEEWGYQPRELVFSRGGDDAAALALLDRFYPEHAGRWRAGTRGELAGDFLATMDHVFEVEGTRTESGVVCAYYRSSGSRFTFGLRYLPLPATQIFRISSDDLLWVLVALLVIFAALPFPSYPALSPSVGALGLGALLVPTLGLLAWQTRDNTAPGLIALLVFVVVAGLFFKGCRHVWRWDENLGVRVWTAGVFFASALAASYLCTNGLEGCVPLCTLMRFGLIPLLTVYQLLPGRAPMLRAACLAPLLLTPHCICDNFANHLCVVSYGASPFCFLPPVAVLWTNTLIRGGCVRRPLFWLQLAAVTGTLLLGISHGLFGYPW